MGKSEHDSSFSSILELAKSGDSNAINTLISRQLQPKGIRVKTVLEGSCLKIFLESEKVLPKQSCMRFIQDGISKLNPAKISHVKIHSLKKGDSQIVWECAFFTGSFHERDDVIKNLKESQFNKHDQTLVNLRKSEQERSNKSKLPEIFLGLKKPSIALTSLVILSPLIIFGLGLRSKHINQKKAEEVEQAKLLFNHVQNWMNTPLANAYTKEKISEKIGSSPKCGQTDADRKMKERMSAGYYETCIWEIRGMPVGAVSYSYSGNDNTGEYLFGIYRVEF